MLLQLVVAQVLLVWQPGIQPGMVASILLLCCLPAVGLHAVRVARQLCG
jgi:hypothetical protein